MGFLFFYLNVLKENRLETFKFLLSLQYHVRQNDNVPSGLPAKFHHRFTPAIGDIVLYYVKKFRQEVALAERVQHVVKILESEDFSGLSNTRDSVLRAANELIIQHDSRVFVCNTDSQRFFPFTSSSSDLIKDVAPYLVSVVEDCYKDLPERKVQSFGKFLLSSLVSPAVIEIRNFVNFYGLHLKNNDSESFLKFFGCICTLLLEVAGLLKSDPIFYILGEAERVLNKLKESFPSFEDMDNKAKLLLSVENSSEKCKIEVYSQKILSSVDLKLEECITSLCNFQ